MLAHLISFRFGKTVSSFLPVLKHRVQPHLCIPKHFRYFGIGLSV
jgi:hypothetical protein